MTGQDRLAEFEAWARKVRERLPEQRVALPDTAQEPWGWDADPEPYPFWKD